MQNLILKSALMLAIFFTTSFSHAQEILPGPVMLRKGVQWLRHNVGFRKIKQGNREDVVYSKDLLYLKILEVIGEERPFAYNAYNSLKSLITKERILSQKYSAELSSLIDSLEMSEEYKSSLIGFLAGEKAPENKVEFNKRSGPTPISETLKMIKKTIDGLYLPKRFKRNTIASIDAIHDLMLGRLKPDDCYDTSAGCQFGSNKGIIRYYDDRVLENHKLALAVLRFGIRIQHINTHFDLNESPTHLDKVDYDLWPVLKDVSGGDERLALEVLSVFGHDVVSRLSPKTHHEYEFLYSVLNANRPSLNGTDSNPRSAFFLPGVLNGVMPRKRFIRKLDKAKKFYEQVYGKKLFVRNGYYHIYGGVLVAQDLYRRGIGNPFGIDMPGLLSHGMGYMYKRLQLTRYLTKDAKLLWNRIKQNEKRVKFLRKKDWEEVRFNKALANLKLHIAFLEYTEEQHRVGAKFARRIYQKRVKK